MKTKIALHILFLLMVCVACQIDPQIVTEPEPQHPWIGKWVGSGNCSTGRNVSGCPELRGAVTAELIIEKASAENSFKFSIVPSSSASDFPKSFMPLAEAGSLEAWLVNDSTMHFQQYQTWRSGGQLVCWRKKGKLEFLFNNLSGPCCALDASCNYPHSLSCSYYFERQ